MRTFRNTVLLVIAVVAVTSLAGVSFAAEKMNQKDMQAGYQAKIKALKDSATIVQATDPNLAQGLNDLAQMKEKKLQEWMDKEVKEDAEEKMLRDSAAVVQKTNPDLAKKLWDMSEHKGMKKGHSEKMMHHEEGEEAGE